MNIFLTGATGLVGGELLVSLAKRPDVDKIFCLLRARNDADAANRLATVFSLHDDVFDREKIIPVTGDLLDENLTKSLQENTALRDVHIVIHAAANTSFSRFNDALVEQVNIGGLTRILLWAKSLPALHTFLYIGTATICGKNIASRVIHEDESPNVKASHVVKYTYTKMQGELLIRQHLPADKILIARPSIIMGDSRAIMPRSPVILWAMATINHLRLIPVNEHAPLDIIPVDYAVQAILGLLFSTRRQHQVYHVSAGEQGATTAFRLAEMLAAYFTGLPPFHFMDKSMLSEAKNWAKNRLSPASDLYSYRDYLDYWKIVFEDKSRLRILFSGLEPYLEFMELGHVFDNTRLLQDVSIGPSEPADMYMKKSLKYLAKMDVLAGEIDP